MKTDSRRRLNKVSSEAVVVTPVAARKSPTSKKYSSVWKIFNDWCVSKQISIHVPDVLQFLQNDFQKGLKPNTLKPGTHKAIFIQFVVLRPIVTTNSPYGIMYTHYMHTP